MLTTFFEPTPTQLSALTSSVTQLRSVIACGGGGDEDVSLFVDLATFLVQHTLTSYVEQGVDLLEALVEGRDARHLRHLCGLTSARDAALDRRPPRRRSTDSLSDSVSTVCPRVARAMTIDSVGDSVDCDVSRVSPSRRRATAPPPSDDVSDDAVVRGASLSTLGDVYFHLALGYAKLGRLDSALYCIERTHSVQPSHPYAAALKERIATEKLSDTVSTTLLVSGLAVLGGLVLGVLLGYRKADKRQR